METHPTLSIIVPVFKVENYLKECLDSILNQTFQNFELILVDDGSPDLCGEICEEYKRLHPEKIKVIHKPNGGLSSARNAGLDIASGEYIGFIDSDDVILTSMYEKLVETAVKDKSDIVFSQVLFWDGEKKTGRKLFNNIILSGKEALKRIYKFEESVSVWSKLFKRELIGEIRFRHGLTNEDFPFVSELLIKDIKVSILPDGFYRYRVTPGSITNVMRPSFFDLFENISYVEKLLPQGDKELMQNFNNYKLCLHINSGVRIVRYRKNKVYKDWLRTNRKYILKNWRSLVFDKQITLRWRAKAIFAFLHIPKLK